MLDQDIAKFVACQSPKTVANALKIAANILSTTISPTKIRQFRTRNTRHQLYIAGEECDEDELQAEADAEENAQDFDDRD